MPEFELPAPSNPLLGDQHGLDPMPNLAVEVIEKITAEAKIIEVVNEDRQPVTTYNCCL